MFCNFQLFPGGTAADTKRAANKKINQQSFIKQDESKAVVKIHLFNGGDCAYRQNEWGNEIVFEKVLYETASHLHIKGASGKEVRNTQDLKDRSNLYDFLKTERYIITCRDLAGILILWVISVMEFFHIPRVGLL